MTPLEAALALLEQGRWPIAVVPGDKREVDINNWWRVRPDADRLRDQFDRNPGAGVALGIGPDEGIVDIDVDDPHAARWWISCLDLAETAGWTSNRGPHYLFQYDERLKLFGSQINTDGLEIWIGVAGKPKSITIPPTPRNDGTPRVWTGYEVKPLPESFFYMFAERQHIAVRDSMIPRQVAVECVDAFMVRALARAVAAGEEVSAGFERAVEARRRYLRGDIEEAEAQAVLLAVWRQGVPPGVWASVQHGWGGGVRAALRESLRFERSRGWRTAEEQEAEIRQRVYTLAETGG